MLKICQSINCNNTVSNKPGTTGKYCSLSCSTRHRNYLNRENKIKEYQLYPNKCKSCNTDLPFKSRKNTYCSRSCSVTETNKNKNRTHSIETKNKLSKIIKQKHASGCYDMTNTRRKIKIKICPECKKEFSRKNTKYCSMVCAKKNMGGYRTPSQLKTQQSFYQGHLMDSGAELYFAKLLDSNGIKWIKNDYNWKKKYPYKKVNEKWYFYYPDFYLPQLNLWIEIKGKRYKREDDCKRYSSVKNHKLVMSDEISEYVMSLVGESNSCL